MMIIYYHEDCLDGAVSAALMARAMSARGHIPLCRPARYDTDDWIGEFNSSDACVFVDICPNPAMKGRLPPVLAIFDHHKSQKEWMDRWYEHGAQVKYSQERSGAGLALEYALSSGAYPSDELQQIALHVEDRDLWKFQLPDTPAYVAFLKRFPAEPEWMEKASEYHVNLIRGLYLPEQASLERKLHKYRTGYIIIDCEFTEEVDYLACYNGRSSEGLAAINAAIDSPKTIACGWHVEGDRAHLSLRGEGAMELAVALGGGGHPTAAGATVSLATWLEALVRRDLRFYGAEGTMGAD